MARAPRKPRTGAAVPNHQPTPRDPWARLGASTPARIGLGRAGISLPTREVLALALAHAEARDAVHASLDVAALHTALSADGERVITVRSANTSRAHYLTRPDLGRRLDDASRLALEAAAGPFDLALVVADGLSATAVGAHAAAVAAAFKPLVAQSGLTLAPVVIAEQARVALGDDIAACLGARAVLVLIGERPGLSSPDSLGDYLTYGPSFGDRRHTDAERNCVSNIRREGLPPAHAAAKLAWLVRESFARGTTGIALKDDSDAVLVPTHTTRSIDGRLKS